MAPIDFQKMRKELIALYEKFVKDSERNDVKEEFMVYENEFGGLSAYNNYLKSKPIPEDIERALGELSTIYLYGLHEEHKEMPSNEEIIVRAKKVLDDLKKEDK